MFAEQSAGHWTRGAGFYIGLMEDEAKRRRRGQGHAGLRSIDFILREWKAMEYFEAR